MYLVGKYLYSWNNFIIILFILIQVEQQAIDREKTCPLLLRVFVSDNGRHHRPEEFSRGNLPGNELQIYTWLV